MVIETANPAQPGSPEAGQIKEGMAAVETPPEEKQSANLTALQGELQAALTALTPQLKGAQDFARLALASESLAQVRVLARDDDRRRGLLTNANEVLSKLTEDGYPKVLSLQVSPAVYADLSGNLAGFEAALARIEEKPAEESGAEGAVEPTSVPA